MFCFTCDLQTFSYFPLSILSTLIDLCFPVVIFFGSLSLACAEGGPDGSHPQNTARCATRR